MSETTTPRAFEYWRILLECTGEDDHDSPYCEKCARIAEHIEMVIRDERVREAEWWMEYVRDIGDVKGNTDYKLQRIAKLKSAKFKWEPATAAPRQT